MKDLNLGTLMLKIVLTMVIHKHCSNAVCKYQEIDYQLFC